MYTTMLEEAVRKMKGEESQERSATQLNLGISLRIDADYIAEENQRLRMYKRIAGAENSGVLADVRAELLDRYGALPDAVVHLLAASELRLECERAGVAQLDRKRTQIPADPKKKHMQPQMREMLHLRFAQDSKADPAQLMQMVAKQAKNGAQFTPQGVLKWPISPGKPDEIITEAKALLESIETPPRS